MVSSTKAMTAVKIASENTRAVVMKVLNLLLDLILRAIFSGFSFIILRAFRPMDPVEPKSVIFFMISEVSLQISSRFGQSQIV